MLILGCLLPASLLAFATEVWLVLATGTGYTLWSAWGPSQGLWGVAAVTAGAPALSYACWYLLPTAMRLYPARPPLRHVLEGYAAHVLPAGIMVLAVAVGVAVCAHVGSALLGMLVSLLLLGAAVEHLHALTAFMASFVDFSD